MVPLQEIEEAKPDTNNRIKKSHGKQKIAIAPIEKKTSRQVTFSKRRSGLFKKASELCFLCGAEVAVVAFSGAGKLFSFGHPSADSVILRYLSSSPSEEDKEVISRIAAENKEKKTAMSSGSSGGYWWNEPIDDGLGLEDLEQLKVTIEGLRNRVFSRLYEINSSSSGYIINNNDNNNNNNISNVMKDEHYIIDYGSMNYMRNFPSQGTDAPFDFAWTDFPVRHGRA